jgi:integrase
MNNKNKNGQHNDGQNINEHTPMNTPEHNSIPDQPTNMNIPHNPTDQPSHIPDNPTGQASQPADSTARNANTGQPDVAKVSKTKKELKLYRSIEAACAAGIKLIAFLRKRPYLTEDNLYLSMEMLYPASLVLLTNGQLIYEFWKESAYRVKKKTIKQYLTHLRQFNTAMKGKPFYLITPTDVARYVRGRTIKKTSKGDVVKQSTHDHTIDVLANFFNFLLVNGYYPRLLSNPVQIRRIGNKRRAPSQACIFTSEEWQRLLDALPWYAVPAAFCMFRLGIRPETVLRVSWEDFDWSRNHVNVNQVINKAYGAFPEFTKEDIGLLKYWQNCTGPIVVFADTVAQIYQTARRLKIRKVFNDDARKSAISLRGALLWELDQEDVVAKLNREFGNSADVRATFYECRRTAEEGTEYAKVTRSFADLVITAKLARDYRMAQMRAAVRVAMAISEATHEHTFTTDPSVIKTLRRAALKKAWESLSKACAFPTFIKIEGGNDLTNAHFARLVKHVEREIAQVIDSLNEIYSHDPDGQLSIFDGQAELFLDGSTISEECPTNPPTSSKKPSSLSDTESPSAQ